MNLFLPVSTAVREDTERELNILPEHAVALLLTAISLCWVFMKKYKFYYFHESAAAGLEAV